MALGNSTLVRKQYGARVAVGLTAVGALARLIPHPANFTPVGGTSLYAGARLRGWQAYMVPVVLMAATDSLLTLLYGYPLFGAVTPVIYGAFLVNVWIGKRFLVRVNARRVAAASALCTVQFFVLTNLGVWMLGNWYPHNTAGLIACFAAAVPFLGGTMLGDLAYAGIFFGLDALAGRLRGEVRPSAAEHVEVPAA